MRKLLHAAAFDLNDHFMAVSTKPCCYAAMHILYDVMTRLPLILYITTSMLFIVITYFIQSKT